MGDRMFKRAHIDSFKPLAHTEGLSVTASGEETLVYDRKRYVIHRLSPEMASVWRLADGTRDLDTLAIESGACEINDTLRHLVAIGLVQSEPARKSLFTRRRMLAGAAGAAAAGTFIAPVAASPTLGGICDVNGVNYIDAVCDASRPNARWHCYYGGQDPVTHQNIYTWHCN